MSLGWEPIWRKHGAHWELQEPESLVVDLARRLKEEGRSRVHDLGCGVGRHLLLLAAEGFETYGSDVSPTAVETCRRRLREAGLSAGVTRSDMTAIPHPDGHLDAVIAWHVLYHGTVQDMDRALGGIQDKLNEGGYLLVTFISTADGQCVLSRELVAEDRASELEPGTFVIPEDATTDKALPHHYSTEREIRDSFLVNFELEWLHQKHERGSDFEERGYRSVHWQALARKRAARRAASSDVREP